MKTKYFLALVLSCSILFVSCKKDDFDNGNTGLSEDIKNFVPQSVLDSLRKWGLKINEGKKPPVIQGIYNISPNICLFDNSGYNRAGNKFADYRYKFSDQDNAKLTISLDYKALSGIDNATGVGSFLAGNAEFFTVFVNVNGVQDGIPYKQIGFYSGTKTDAGIKDLQHGFYLTEKGPDPNNKLVKVGTSRIFHDSDKSSEANSFYRGVSGGIKTLGAK